MAVSNTNSIDRYVGNGANPYSITFDFASTSNVFADIEDADGAITTLSHGSGMTVSTSPAQITTDTSYDSTYKVSVYRVVPYTQPTDLTASGAVPVETLEAMVDNVVRQVQQIKDNVNTVVRVQLTDSEIDPLPSSLLRRGKVAYYSDTADAPPSVITMTELEEALAAVRSGTAAESIVSKTDSFTLVSTISSQLIEASKATAITVTLPDDSSIPIGARFDVVKAGVGDINFAAAAGVTINSSVGATPSIETQHSGASIVKTGDLTFRVFGDIV